MRDKRVSVSWNLLAAVLIVGLVLAPLLAVAPLATRVALAAEPVISGLQVTGISETGAVITWNTSIDATGNVEYGTSSGVYPNSAPDPADTTANSTTHMVMLSGLDPDTTYYFRVKSSDGVDPPAVSDEYSFKTNAFTIAGIAHSSVTANSATITWVTTLGGAYTNTTSNVEYGTTPAYGSSAPQPPDATADTSSHVVVLSGLEASTTYHYRVVSENAGGDEEVSGDRTFTTAADTTPPDISSVVHSDVGSSGATITWDTNKPATSKVVYGTSAVADDPAWTSFANLTDAYDAKTDQDDNLVSSHGVTLSGLSASQTYYYRALSKDASGNEAWSDEYEFKTEPDTTPPVISAVASSGETETGAIIGWDTNKEATSKVVYRTSSVADPEWANVDQVKDAYGNWSPESIVLTGSHSVSLSGITAGTEYFYRALSRDALNNWRWSDEYSFTTVADTTPPVIFDVEESGLSDSGVVIGWRTDEPATSQVVFGTVSADDPGWTGFAQVIAAYASKSIESGAVVMTHSVMLSGLDPDTKYYYRVLSKDAADNEQWSAEGSFTTDADTTKPVISGVDSSGITYEGVTIEWDTDKPATSQVVFDTVSQAGPFADLAALRDAYSHASPEDTALAILGHSVSLGGLLSNTTYYYRVVSVDASGNYEWSAEGSFTTDIDTTPPQFSAVEARNITETTAHISWNTDKLSTTQVVYGTASHDGPFADLAALLAAYAQNTAKDPGKRGTHNVTLAGLDPDTKYYYRVISGDEAGNIDWSEEKEFTTLPDQTPPPVPPIHSPADGALLLSNLPVLQWTTVSDSSPPVTYDLQVASDSGFATLVVDRQGVSVADGAAYGLHTFGDALADGTYYWRVRAIDGVGNASNWNVRSFTVDTTPPSIELDNLPYHPYTGPVPTFTGTATDTATRVVSVEYRVLLRADSTVVIDWTAADPVDGAFDSLVEQFTLTISDMDDGWYLLEVRAADEAGHVGTAGYNAPDGFMVTTKPLVRLDPDTPMTATPPMWVTDDMRTRDSTPTFHGDATSTTSTISKVLASINGGDWQEATITATADGATWEFTPSALAEGTYNIRVKAVDATENESPAEMYEVDGVAYLAFTIDLTPPVISNVRVVDLGPNSVTIKWTTNEPATSRIEYGTDTSYGSFSDEDTELKTEHSITLTGLSFRTTYHYRLISVDDVGNEQVSEDMVFTTPLPVWIYAVAGVGGLLVLVIVISILAAVFRRGKQGR